ncbi:MAG: RNA polymerase sigma factor, partial [Chloroflexota bacterium]
MERRLVEAAQQGDEAAFSEIAFEISPRLFAIAQRILRDFHAAEDATQQALVRIWRKLPSLSD